MSSPRTPAERLAGAPALAAAGAAACALSVVALARFGPEPRALVAAFVLSTLAVLSAIDVERRLLPNRIVLPATAVVLSAQTAFFPERAAEWALASIGAALVLFLPLLVRPSAMGMGDVKLGLLLGAALGEAVVPALALGAVSAVPVAVYLLVRGGPQARKTTIPFGPFLAFGAAVVLLAAS
jgi:leader peptidase (prepilin peptidase)/N-methyltransferase